MSSFGQHISRAQHISHTRIRNNRFMIFNTLYNILISIIFLSCMLWGVLLIIGLILSPICILLYIWLASYDQKGKSHTNGYTILYNMLDIFNGVQNKILAYSKRSANIIAISLLSIFAYILIYMFI